MSLSSKKKIPSLAQLWAQERNLTKGQLKGMVTNLRRMIYLPSVTYGDWARLDRAAEKIEIILKGWDVRNETSKMTFISLKKGNY